MRFLQNSFPVFSGELPQSNIVALCLIAAVVDFSPIIFLSSYFNFFKQVISIYSKARSLSDQLYTAQFIFLFVLLLLSLDSLGSYLKETLDSHSLFTCSITFTSTTYPSSSLSPAEGSQLTLGSVNPPTILVALLHFHEDLLMPCEGKIRSPFQS